MSSLLQQTAVKLVDQARKAGAVEADALVIAHTGHAIRVRNAAVESVEREDSRGLGLRVFVQSTGGLAFASASTSDVSDAGIQALVAQTLTMAHISTPDPDAVPPTGAVHPNEELQRVWAHDHMQSDPLWDIDAAQQAAQACEHAALASSSQISNSEGAEASFGTSAAAYACADGFSAAYQKSTLGLGISLIAGTQAAMQRDYAFHHVRNLSDLRSPESLGEEAAQRTIKRLNASGLSSRKMHVVFEPRVATSLMGHLASGINGRAVMQQRSFLSEDAGKRILPVFVNITDDPDHPQGLGNRLFDGEGTCCRSRNIIEAGYLTGFLTDRYAAKRLNTEATGHARRGLTGDIGIGTSNLILHPGQGSQADILAEIGDGLLITELIGFGVNGVTGDYSRGAVGFLIEDGQIKRPVQEITIAGNLRQMFQNITHIGNDLTWFGSSASPSVAIADMAVAGQP